MRNARPQEVHVQWPQCNAHVWKDTAYIIGRTCLMCAHEPTDHGLMPVRPRLPVSCWLLYGHNSTASPHSGSGSSSLCHLCPPLPSHGLPHHRVAYCTRGCTTKTQCGRTARDADRATGTTTGSDGSGWRITSPAKNTRDGSQWRMAEPRTAHAWHPPCALPSAGGAAELATLQ